ncbi:MAG: outer membrane protein assembly factor BamA [Pseudomonadota bacterium]
MRIKFVMKSVFFLIALMVSAIFLPNLQGMEFSHQAHAAVVNDIDVRGNERIEDDVVVSYITIQPRVRFNDFDIDDSVKALFATGLFSDVSIFQEGSILIVDVDENATVNKVFFEGNSRLKDDALTGIVRLQPRSIYSDEQAATDVERINVAYSRVGRRDASVSYEAVPLANNRINVIYRVDEGDKTKIGSITFIGNTTFPERRLLDVISTKESTIFSFLTTSDIFDQNRINSDEEALRRFYFNKGFADFQIISTNAELDTAENEYHITITLDEGPRYTFGNIDIDSTISGLDSASLLDLIETKPGEFYSAKYVEESIVAITERVSEEGFAFVEVVPRGNRNFEDNTIDVTYLVDEGARLFIEDIRILGNDRTRDYVIRREFDISEGDAYNQVLIQRTRDRIQGLGFFQSVNITTRPGSSPDRVIVFVTVTEQSTGDITLAGGFSSNGGASANISLTERNFLGRGQFLRLGVNAGDDEESYNFNFTEPYFLGYRIAAGLSLQAVESDETSERQYIIDSTSGTISFGIPIVENLSSSVFYTYRGSDASANAILLDNDGDLVNTMTGNNNNIQGDADTELSAALVQGLGDFTASGFGYTLLYNTLDSAQSPREGIRASLSQTFFGAGGDAEYFATEASLVGYHTLSEEEDVVLFGRVRGGHIEVFGADNGTIAGGFRTIDNFQARNNSIRGFDSFGFGPRDPLTGDPLGGRTFWNATAELQFPIPFIPRSLGIRGAVFADAGQLTNVGDAAIAAVNNASVTGVNGRALNAAELAQVDDDALRASIGGSVLWASPFGPLRVDYAVPISEEVFDDVEEFNFGVSSAF